MSRPPSLIGYFLRDSLLRWSGRASSPLSRFAVSLSLSTAALLVLASLALGMATLKERIARFGLDSLMIHTSLEHAADPMPGYHRLGDYGKTLSLKLAYANTEINLGGSASLAFASESTFRELVTLGIPATGAPLLLTTTLPPDIPIRASLGPWSVEALTASIPLALHPAGLTSLLIARPEDFPMQARAPGQALTLLIRADEAPALDAIVHALEEVAVANPTNRNTAPTVQTALPLMRELNTLQSTWRRYVTLLGAVLAATIAAVFGASAILEYEATAYATALLRSFGASRATIWLQRYLEAALLANLGGSVALLTAVAVSRMGLPQITPHLFAISALAPLFLALNLGALLAAIPVALAMRKPVGLILQ